ncbi:PIN domain-like protein [Mycena olivaceomarginata]|nr:PIN domain-like protein [Mycena olivaceomarginata]
MGIPKFWECIADAAEEYDFLQLTVKEGFKHGSGECRPILMGVDASIWMYQADRAVKHGNMKAGPNPALRILYYRLVALLALPLRIVFVEDGPERLEVKRDTHVLTRGHPLTPQFRELVRQFGYHCHVAPGEADAELGRPTSEGLIDIVQTTDSDVFLFGAPTVIKIPQKKADGNNVTVYSSEKLFINPGISLTRGGILLIALLAGGDYHKGIPGCGIKTAHAIARGNLGDLLLQKALENPTPTAAFLEFLTVWKTELCVVLSTNPHGHLGRRYQALSAVIAETLSFPDIDVIFAYVHPITSWSENHSPPDNHHWGLAQPNLAGIARFCQNQFGWDAPAIAAKFSKSLYPGVAVQSLLKPYDLLVLLEAHIESGLSSDDNFPRSAVLRVLQSRTTMVQSHTFKQYKVEMSTGALNLRVKAAIRASAFTAPTLMIKWIPAPIIDYALPDLVSRSKTSAKVTKSRSKPRGSRMSAMPQGKSRTPGASKISLAVQDIIDLTTPEPEDLTGRAPVSFPIFLC